MMPVANSQVLVADEEPLTRWAVARAVEALGLGVVQAATREEACGLLFARRFHAVVMANRLFEHDMTDVLAELERYQPETSLVVLCEGEPAQLRVRLPRAVVLEKPFSVDELMALEALAAG